MSQDCSVFTYMILPPTSTVYNVLKKNNILLKYFIFNSDVRTLNHYYMITWYVIYDYTDTLHVVPYYMILQYMWIMITWLHYLWIVIIWLHDRWVNGYCDALHDVPYSSHGSWLHDITLHVNPGYVIEVSANRDHMITLYVNQDMVNVYVGHDCTVTLYVNHDYMITVSVNSDYTITVLHTFEAWLHDCIIYDSWLYDYIICEPRLQWLDHVIQRMCLSWSMT